MAEGEGMRGRARRTLEGDRAAALDSLIFCHLRLAEDPKATMQADAELASCARRLCTRILQHVYLKRQERRPTP